MFKFIYVTAHIHFEEQMKVLCHTVGTDVAQNCHKEFSLTKNPGKKGRVSHLSYIRSYSVFLSIEPGASFSHMLNCIVISWVNCKQLIMSATETFLSE